MFENLLPSQAMKRIYFSPIFFSLFLSIALGVSALMTTPAALYAEDIKYEGDGTKLQNSPSWSGTGSGSDNSLFPGSRTTPSSSDNRVIIEYVSTDAGVTNPDYVFGGLSQAGNVTNSSVELIDGYVINNVYGGYGRDGAVTGNAVTISGGRVDHSVYGGYSSSGDVTDNMVIVSGGYVRGSVYGAWSNSGDVTGNTVTISDGSGGIIDTSVYGGYSLLKSAADNRVTISGSRVGSSVYGGYSRDGSATGNMVTITNVSVGRDVYGGWSSVGSATGNTVIITNVSVAGNVGGGWNDINDSGASTGNTVTISGGSVGGNVYGGRSHNNISTGNTVTISDAPDLKNSKIYGGHTNGYRDVFTGNTFNLKSSNLSVDGIYNFENYNFYLPDGVADDDIMLRSANAVDVNNTNAAIFLKGNAALQAGDKVALINSAAGINGSPLNDSCRALLGTFLQYDFSIYTDSENLWGKVASIRTTPQIKVITNSRLAPLAFINQGADLAAATDDYAISRDKTDRRYTAFAAVNGGSSTYDTGSDVDVDGVSLIAGVIWDVPVSRNQLLLSAFAEAGWGEYDTCNKFSGSSVRGSGDMDYYGGGIRARYQFTKNAPGGLYTDASLRVGKINSDFNSQDLADAYGTRFKYDSDSTYYGAHLGIGCIWQLSEKTNIDVSSKYLWARLDGDSFVSKAGDRIEFDDADSRRWRTGFRVNHARSGRVTLYGGLAYEYEFDGDATGQLFGAYALDKSSLSGGTGIGELGVRFKPSANNDRMTLVLDLKGYAGTREGVSGGFKLFYDF